MAAAGTNRAVRPSPCDCEDVGPVETLAQAIFAEHASWQAEMGTAPASWTEIRPRSREYWRRLARAGIETMEGSPNG